MHIVSELAIVGQISFNPKVQPIYLSWFRFLNVPFIKHRLPKRRSLGDQWPLHRSKAMDMLLSPKIHHLTWTRWMSSAIWSMSSCLLFAVCSVFCDVGPKMPICDIFIWHQETASQRSPTMKNAPVEAETTTSVRLSRQSTIVVGKHWLQPNRLLKSSLMLGNLFLLERYFSRINVRRCRSHVGGQLVNSS